MIRTNQSTTDVDLALALENEEGTFLAQKAGHSFLVVAEKGHSIASMRAVGQVLAVPPSSASDPWYITKISNAAELTAEGGGSRDRSGREASRLVRD
jgi:hypothetical protein